MKIVIPVSAGELVDKITILEIKSLHIKDTGKVNAVKKEKQLLNLALSSVIAQKKIKQNKFRPLKEKLYSVNLKLWNIENTIRKLEAEKDFGDKFTVTARKVYLTNDKRSVIKKEINQLFGPGLDEIKEYPEYK